jgi:hypothetical protein
MLHEDLGIANRRIDELLLQLADAPERGPGTDPITAIGIQTLSQAVEMLREDVDRERAGRAERQVEDGCKRVDELQASLADERRLADARTAAMFSGGEVAALRTQLELLTDERRRPWWRRWLGDRSDELGERHAPPS